MNSRVVAVCCNREHTFSKDVVPSITLVQGMGVEGDAHFGATTQHLYQVKQDPSQPNLRQVHLIHQELLDELNQGQFDINPGSLGENITTEGLELLELPTRTKLLVGQTAIILLTGLRNPCSQLDKFQKGLTKAVLEKQEDGTIKRKSGVMGIVLRGGRIYPDDPITIELPLKPWEPLSPV